MTKIISYPVIIHKTALLFSKNFIYLKNFNTVLPTNVLSINRDLNSVFFNFFGSKLYLSSIFILSVSWYTKKLKFKHKLSWFFFKRKFLKLFIYQIGKSHFIFQALNAYIIRKKRYTIPNSLIFFSINWRFLNIYVNKVKQIQPINPYTLRGLRLSRQNIYKRQGKVSKYSGLKSKIF